MFYREDGDEWEVEVLADKTDDEGMRTVKLRCVREIQPSPMCGPIPPGEVWESAAMKGFEAYVGWSLHAEASS